MSENLKVRVTGAYRIPGRGTVLLVDADDCTKINRGDLVTVTGHDNMPIYGVERTRGENRVAGLAMGGAILPDQITIPCYAEVVINGR